MQENATPMTKSEPNSDDDTVPEVLSEILKFETIVFTQQRVRNLKQEHSLDKLIDAVAEAEDKIRRDMRATKFTLGRVERMLEDQKSIEKSLSVQRRNSVEKVDFLEDSIYLDGERYNPGDRESMDFARALGLF